MNSFPLTISLCLMTPQSTGEVCEPGGKTGEMLCEPSGGCFEGGECAGGCGLTQLSGGISF